MIKVIKTYHILYIILLSLSFGSLNEVQGQLLLDTQKIKSVHLFNETNINTEEIEYAPSFMNDKLVFLFSDVDNYKERGTGEYFFDLGFALTGLNKALLKKASFGKSLNTRYHEGPACYDPNLDVMYVTRSGNKGKGKLKIYRHEHPESGGKNEALNISSKHYSIGHPTVFGDGDKMILISDKSANEREMNLWESTRSGDEWSELAPLSDLNTSSQELFPYMHKDSFLFFSSNRPGGFGGLDIYCSRLTYSGWEAPVLLPAPINSDKDDFSMIINENGTLGYITSNREGGRGKDDIYRFEAKESIFTAHTGLKKEVLILDKLSLSPVEDAAVSVVPIILSGVSEKSNFKIDINPQNQNGELIMKYVPSDKGDQKIYRTDTLGNTVIPINTNTQYLLRITHEDFETSTVIVQNSEDELIIVIDPKPHENNERVSVLGSTIEVGSVLLFDHIYYTEQNEINVESTYELDALANSMIENEGLFVDIIVHTDARGNKIDNLELSKKRALSTLFYLVSKGIDENRIIASGRGEEEILNHCTEGVPCSEGEHLENRRTEIQIRSL